MFCQVAWLSAANGLLVQALQLFEDLCKREGRESVVSRLVEPHDLPLLYYAVAGGSKELVQHFLDAGAAFDMTTAASSSRPSLSHRNVPVLAVAAALGDHEMLQLLLSRGADPLSIPHHLWLPEMEQMEYHGLPQVVEDQAAAASSWCSNPADQQLLSSKLVGHVVMPYWLTRAQKIRGQVTNRWAGCWQLTRLSLFSFVLHGCSGGMYTLILCYAEGHTLPGHPTMSYDPHNRACHRPWLPSCGAMMPPCKGIHRRSCLQ
jgi:hypothetical protein